MLAHRQEDFLLILYGILPLHRHTHSGVQVASYFVPLHSSPHGRRSSSGAPLPRTARLASWILRLPIHPKLSETEVQYTVGSRRQALGG
jgi:dTDP-4-amino-4,6-dideoxygalactose transaminase